MSSTASQLTTAPLSSTEEMELRQLIEFLSQKERKYFLSLGDQAPKILAIAAFLEKQKDEICSLSEERKKELKDLWAALEPSHHSFLRTFKVKPNSFANAARKGVTPGNRARALPARKIVKKKRPQTAAAPTEQTSLPDVEAGKLTCGEILGKFKDLSFAKKVWEYQYGKWTVYTQQTPTCSTADQILDELKLAFPKGEWSSFDSRDKTFAVNVFGLSIEDDFKTALLAYVDLRVSELES